jgi:hypothetical protein
VPVKGMQCWLAVAFPATTWQTARLAARKNLDNFALAVCR